MTPEEMVQALVEYRVRLAALDEALRGLSTNTDYLSMRLSENERQVIALIAKVS